MPRAIAILAILLCAAPATLPCRADTVRLSGGRVVTGVVESETDQRVTVRTTEGLVSFPRAQVQQIERVSSSERMRVQADLAARGGRFAEFLRAQAGPTANVAVAEIDDVIAINGDSLAREFARAPAADVMLLATYLDNRPTSAPAAARVVMARVHAERRQFTEATRWLAGLDSKQIAAVPSAQAWAAEFLKQRIRDAVTANEPEWGLQCLALLAQIAPETVERSTSVPLVLARAARLAEQGQPTEAIRVLKMDLEPLSAAIAFQAAMRMARDAILESTGPAQLPVYRALLYSFQGDRYDAEAAPLLEHFARALIAYGEFSEARKIAVRLGAVDADAAARLEHRVEFEMRRQETNADDLLAIYRLGCWAADRGLEDEARTMFRQAAKDPALRENADLRLQAMQLDFERGAFDRVVAAFEARDYAATIRLGGEFRTSHPASTLLQRVKTMEEVARFQMQRQERLVPQQADALYQNAERLYYQGRYREAIEILDRLETEFAGLPAARRSAQMRAAIGRKAPELANRTTSSTGTVAVVSHSDQRAAASRAAYLGEIMSLMQQISESQTNQPK